MIRCTAFLSLVFLFTTATASQAVIIDNHDGTLTDTETGLEWISDTFDRHSWDGAIKACDDLVYAGHDDWRLPDRNELQTLVDSSTYNPAADDDIFIDMKSEYYWTSTSYAPNPDEQAWGIDFWVGNIYRLTKTKGYYVRPVRGGPRAVHIPHITGGYTDWRDRLTVDNTGPDDQEFVLTLFADGRRVYKGTLTAPAGCQTQIDLKSMADAAQTGSIVYTSPMLHFRVTQQNLNGGGIAEFALSDGLLSELGFYFSHGFDAIEWQGLALANISDTTAEVALSATSGCDESTAVVVDIPPFSRILGLVDQWFPDMAPAMIESIRARTDRPGLTGVSISGDSGSKRLLFTRASGLDTEKTTLYIPHVTGGFSDWRDVLQADNPSAKTVSFTLTLFAEGSQVYAARHTIGPGCRLELNLKSLAETADCGLVTVEDKSLSARLTRENLDGGGITEFYLTDSVEADLGFFFSDAAQVVEWKGIALTNFGSTEAEITLTAEGECGNLGTRTIALPPYIKRSGTVSELFPSLDPAEVERITATSENGSLAGVTIAGTRENDRLIFTRAAPLPQ